MHLKAFYENESILKHTFKNIHVWNMHGNDFWKCPNNTDFKEIITIEKKWNVLLVLLL